MTFSKKDIQIVRELGKKVAEIAALPIQEEKRRLWRALNGLRPERPMVMIDQLPWHEMDVDGELEVQSENEFCRWLENHFRRILYLWKHMPADMVVESYVEVNKVIYGTDFGIKVEEHTLVTDPMNSVVSHKFVDQLQTEEDLEKIRIPQVRYDKEATMKKLEMAHELLDGIIDIRLQGYFPNNHSWDLISTWKGVENILYDLIDRPEFMHKLMSRLTTAYLSMLDQLEEQGLLGYGQTTIHCTGAYTDELPAPGFNPKKPRAKDLWTFGLAQVFSTVSPEMHQEFELDYCNRWFERFGLVYYGCCDPLDGKMDIVRKIPNLRKVSMSPWVNVERGAQGIGKDFVFSRKPSPAFLAGTQWEPEVVEKDLRETRDICRKYGCPVEFILKDVSTIRYQPQRLWEWANIAKRVCED
ncbi:MAG: hypothetical protein HPY74_13950 [Firmicutes bacterium]|nr:hypothetical protein [Bacillota bacterium]